MLLFKRKKEKEEDFQDLSIHKYELVEIRLNIYIYWLTAMRQFRDKYSVEVDLMNANYDKCCNKGSCIVRTSLYERKKIA